MRSAARRIISVVLVALVAAATLAPFLYMIARALMAEFDVLRYPPQLLPARPHPENSGIARTAQLVSVWGIFLLRQFFLTIPGDLEDAARLDGAGEWAVFWRVVLPLSKPALATLAGLAFRDQWKSLLWPLVATRSAEMSVVEVG